VGIGVLVAVGTVVPLAANLGLERAVLGSSLRAERAAGTVETASASGSNIRLREAAITSLGISADGDAPAIILGAAAVAAIAVAAWRRDPRILLFAGALYVARTAQGFGFVPGFLVAAPIGAVGLTMGWRRGPPARLAMAIALVALPLVWAVQYTGGAGPQWGGRYVLLSGFALGVVGLAALDDADRAIRLGSVALAVFVTAFGLGWMHQRTTDVAASAEQLERLPQPILVSRVAHLVREGAGVHDLHRWLTAISYADLHRVARIADAKGADSIAVVDFPGASEPARIGGLTREKSPTVVRFVHGVPLNIWVYNREATANRS
jgi:hypothetical protein